MSHSTNATQHPLFLGFAAYTCSHLALFSVIGLLGLPLPALWWASLALIPSWMLFRRLERLGHSDLAQLVGVQALTFAGSVLGLHARELFCLSEALI